MGKGEVTLRRNRWVILLAFLHGTMLFAPLYVMIGSMAKLRDRLLFQFSVMGAMVIVPVILSYVMLRKLKRLSSYVVLTVVSVGSFFVLGFRYGDFFHYGNVILGTLNGFVALIIFVIRSQSRIEYNQMKGEFYAVHDESEPFYLSPWEVENFLSEPSLVHWGWFGILYVLSVVFKFHYAIYEIFFLMIADVFICFTCRYADVFYQYMKMNRRVASMPASTMNHVHKRLFLIGLLAIGFFLLPAVLYLKEPLENVDLEKKTTIAYTVEQQQQNYELLHIELETEVPELIREYSQHESPKWIRYVFTVILVIVGIVAVVGIVYGLVQGIKNMAHAFQMEEEDEVINLDEVPETSRTIRKKSGLFQSLSEEARIRRRYKKAIRKGIKGSPNPAATPTELEQEAGLLAKEDQELHQQYERVRYDR